MIADSSGIGRLTQVTWMQSFRERFSLVMFPPQMPHPMLDVIGIPL